MQTTGYYRQTGQTEANDAYEVVRIEKTKSGCHLCEEYAERQKSKPGSCIFRRTGDRRHSVTVGGGHPDNHRSPLVLHDARGTGEG